MSARTCDGCGNEYDKTFTVTMGETSYSFDSFECAIHKLAPRCAGCGCPIVGHGAESNGVQFCCAHCARKAGENRVQDRAS